MLFTLGCHPLPSGASSSTDSKSCLFFSPPPPPPNHSARNRSYSKSPGALARGLRGRTASASSRSSSLGGDEERRPLFKSGGSRSHGSISTSIAATTAANTLSNNRTITRGGEGGAPGFISGDKDVTLGGSGGATNGSVEGTNDAGRVSARFSKPTKAVSFAGEESIPDSPAAQNRGSSGFRKGNGSESARAALEEGSGELSPLRGSRLALLPQQGAGYGAAAGVAGEENNENGGSAGASKTSSMPHQGPAGTGDVYGSGLSEMEGSTTSGDTGSHAPVGGEREEEEEDGEMASFIVLDCSRVTNVSGMVHVVL